MLKNRSNLGISTFVLLVSGFVCKVLGALFRLPLTNFIGIEGIGIFQLVMSLYSFALVLTCGGVTATLSKLIGAARAKGEYEKINTYLSRALFVCGGIGIILGVGFLFLGKVISSLQGIDVGGSYSFFILLLPLGAILATFRGFFQGFENMFPTAISQILEQVAKFALGLAFAVLFGRRGTSSGVFGAFLGIVLSEVVATIYIFATYLFKRKSGEKMLFVTKETRREFDHANFLLTFSASVVPLTNALDGLFIVPRLTKAGFLSDVATQLYGLQTGVVGAVLNFPLIISMAVTTALLPNISYAISKGVGGKFIIERGLKILLFLILPTTFGMVAISSPLLTLLYKNLSEPMLKKGFELMLFGGFSVVFTALMQYLIMLLQANGQFKFILLCTALGGVAKVLITFFLSALPAINIFALPLGNLVLAGIVSVMSVWKLKKLVSFTLPFADAFALIFGTLCMFLCVYTFVACNYFKPLLNLLLAVLLGVVVYGVFTIPFVLKLGIFKKREQKEV